MVLFFLDFAALNEMRAFGTESGFHDRGASAWGELSGNQQLLSDVAQGLSVGQGQVAVFRGVDLGGLGEDKTVFFILFSLW